MSVMLCFQMQEATNHPYPPPLFSCLCPSLWKPQGHKKMIWNTGMKDENVIHYYYCYYFGNNIPARKHCLVVILCCLEPKAQQCVLGPSWDDLSKHSLLACSTPETHGHIIIKVLIKFMYHLAGLRNTQVAGKTLSLGASVRVFLEEISISIRRLNKKILLPMWAGIIQITGATWTTQGLFLLGRLVAKERGNILLHTTEQGEHSSSLQMPGTPLNLQHINFHLSPVDKAGTQLYWDSVLPLWKLLLLPVLIYLFGRFPAYTPSPCFGIYLCPLPDDF